MMEKPHSKWIGPFWRRRLLLVATLLALNARVTADGGLVLLHQADGPFTVTVFAAPNPLRVGPVDISVLVQDRRDGQPVLDGEVFVWLRREGGMRVSRRATREVAQNKLLYSALMNLPEAGPWELEVIVEQGKGSARVLGQVSAASPRPFLLSYWRSLLLPPIVVTLFAWNQWLKRRAASRRKAKPRGRTVGDAWAHSEGAGCPLGAELNKKVVQQGQSHFVGR